MAYASGKLILLGEHAVVYGVPAIAAGIPRGVTAQALRADIAELKLGDQRALAGEATPLGNAFRALLETLALGPHAVDVKLALPPGAGLGASAAIGVAIARAVLEAAGEPLELTRVLAAAGAWEGVFHGNASGIDAAAAALGGCFRYTRGAAPEPLPVARTLHFAIALSGPAASTRTMVEGVARLREEQPELVAETLAEIATLVARAEGSVRLGELAVLGQLMDRNQVLLAQLGVSTEPIERACAVARSAGALGAKLTGAGGGGAVIALSEEEPIAIVQALETAGFPAFSASVGESMSHHTPVSSP